jgi:exosome complex component RRP42
MGRIIDRGIRESKFIQFDKLCIKAGEKVWSVFVDIYAINDAGNMMDAAALAALVALANAKIPVYNEKEGKAEHEHTKDSLPLNKEMMAFNMTLYKIDGSIIADPTKEEESLGEFRLSVAMAPNKGEPLITSMQKGREEPISSEDMTRILNMLNNLFKEIYPKILKELW